ncbi:MAG: rRNA adenine N-6-methyltransferase family protein [Candidatus Beckwithbacteria bacterium]
MVIECFNNLAVRFASERLISLLQESGISSQTLEAIRKTPRHLFAEGTSISEAYNDDSISLSNESSLSQPSVVGRMTDLLPLDKELTVLEIGTATGWQAAILSHLAKQVITVEIIKALALKAQERFKLLGINNIQSIIGDGSDPYIIDEKVDRLIVTAAVKPNKPYPPILEVLKPDGIAVLPLSVYHQNPIECELTVYQKTKTGVDILESHSGYRFVLLKGAFSWK